MIMRNNLLFARNESRRNGSGLIICFLLFLTAGITPAQNDQTSQWPGFRGPGGTGIMDNVNTVVNWNTETGENIKWKISIPGLAHSSPVIWEDRIFVTTAVSDNENPVLSTELSGSINPVEGETSHQWKVYCLDKKTGKILWEKTAHEGVPKVKRHPMATHANSTAATDGKYVVAFFWLRRTLLLRS